ncbi:2-hydroxychromene-2-carboxylate isomerase [Chelatococcus reniformis]|uniref:2-hydroxychromene-2-carboxylate isomerase n=1 Tax=Chelatococcus reniformis TaxID=1494448 RepID=A0A916UWW3_9HYPH|nr:2-hydroxychromene-2-carboxylate isomerase [Chelatococcus reniformis]GGC91885.1 2-hydroxychromene-2-carboxylate isomerase [Chelatococcus reniformis]
MIEIFFDCSSPWTYLAFHGVRQLAAELDVEVAFRPILVGGIFNTTNPSVYAWRAKPVPAKARYLDKDLQDWARLYGLKIKMPPSVFPVNSVKVMRGCIYLGRSGRLVDFATAAFETYWGDDLDISKDEVIATVLARAGGIDEAAFFAGITRDDVKAELRANTAEVMERGGFGSPTFFVDGTDMYFGNDRLALIRDAVLRDSTPAGRASRAGGTT